MTTSAAPAVDLAAERARVQVARAEEWATARARMLLGRMRQDDPPATMLEAAKLEWPSFTAEARCRIVERALELERSGDGARHLDPATTTVQPMEPSGKLGGRKLRQKTAAWLATIRGLLRESPGLTAREVLGRLGDRHASPGSVAKLVTAARVELGIPAPVTGGPGRPKKAKPAPAPAPKKSEARTSHGPAMPTAKLHALREALEDMVRRDAGTTARGAHAALAGRGIEVGLDALEYHVTATRKRLGIPYPVAKKAGGNGKKPAAHPHDPHEVSPEVSPRSGSGVQVGGLRQDGETERTAGETKAVPAETVGVSGETPTDPPATVERPSFDPQTKVETGEAYIERRLAEIAADQAGSSGQQVAETEAPSTVGVPVPSGDGGLRKLVAQVEPQPDAGPLHDYAESAEAPGVNHTTNHTTPDTQRITEPARPSIEAYQRGDGTWTIRASGPIGFIYAVVATLYEGRP